MSTTTLLPPKGKFLHASSRGSGFALLYKNISTPLSIKNILNFFSFYIQRDRVLLILRLLAKSSITADSIK